MAEFCANCEDEIVILVSGRWAHLESGEFQCENGLTDATLQED